MNTFTSMAGGTVRWLLPMLASMAVLAAQAADAPQAPGQAPPVRQPLLRQPQGPVIGMAIDVRTPADASGEGVRIVSVSPGGPAANAGLQANDVVVSFAGQALRGNASGSAAEQLTAAISAARVGAPATLEYRRDGKVVTTQVTPMQGSGPPRRALPDFPQYSEALDLGRRVDDRLLQLGRRNLGAFGAMELTELTPTLGRYFGTDKGLLVVRAPADASLKLEDGDVILDIDGRVPGNAGHALQILGSYRTGESLKLHVMRQQKKIELALEVPQLAAMRPMLLPQPPRPPPPRGAEGAGAPL